MSKLSQSGNEAIIAELLSSFLNEQASTVVVSQASKLIERQGVSARVITRQGIALLEASILSAVKQHPRKNTTQVAAMLGLDEIDPKNNLTQSILVFLEKQGKLHSERDGTSRRWTISE